MRQEATKLKPQLNAENLSRIHALRASVMVSERPAPDAVDLVQMIHSYPLDPAKA